MTVPAITVTEGGTEVRLLVRDLMRVPEQVRNELRPALREAGSEVLRDASARAGWSTRIPGAMSLRVSFSKARPGVFITVSQSRAPHARPLEGILGQGSFRHPTFGGDPWVSQATRPYLLPALVANEGRAYTVIQQAVDRALARAGL